MRRATVLIAVGLALLTASCFSRDDDELRDASVNQPAGTYQPRAVPQLGHSAPISALTWTNDERNLVSIDSAGIILLWDVESQLILDRMQANVGEDWITFHALERQEDPAKLSLLYAFVADEDGMPAGATAACPEEALRENLWCTFTLDLATREITPDQSIPIPDRPWIEVESQTQEDSFPASPSGQWLPETFRLVDRPELANPGAGIVHVPEPEDFPGHDCASYTRCDYGILLSASGRDTAPIALVGEKRIFVSDLDISPDGHSLVQINSYHTEVRSWSWVRSTDLLTFREESAIENEQDYKTVSWLDELNFAMFGRGFADYGDRNQDEVLTGPGMRFFEDEDELREEIYEEAAIRDRDPFPPARLVNRECMLSNSCPSAAAFYAMEPLNNQGDYIGAGNTTDCEVSLGQTICVRTEAGGTPVPEELRYKDMSDGISRYHAASGQWRRMVQPDWNGEEIWALRLSPDKRQLAVLTREGFPQDIAAPTLRLRLFEIEGDTLRAAGPVLLEKSYSEEADYGDMFSNGGNMVDSPPQLLFTPDGSRIVFSHYMRNVIDTEPDAYELVVVTTDGSASARHHLGRSQNFVPLDEDRVFEVESGHIVDLDSGEVLATVRDRPDLLNAGLIEASRLIWGAGTDGRIQFWDADTGTLELSLYMLPDNQFFAMTPGGRYDTNLGPESRAMRWVMLDDPWQSLEPQTYMRDFYEPGLYARLLDCREQDNCDSAFRPLPAFDQINRVLPTVEIVDVVAGDGPNEVVVTVEAREGIGADGSTSSGIYNLRLFRNGRLVAMTPDRIEEIPSGARSWQDTVERWRRSNRLGEGSTYRTSFRVPLPSGGGTYSHDFAAYAFNEDRIKSGTARHHYFNDDAGTARQQSRAYVINIGIDGYAESDLQLNYAVSDAELLGRQLARVPEYDTRQLSLLARRNAGGRGVTRETILQALQLVTSDQNRAANLAALEAAGIDASMLEAATPDDLLIVTYSGHGWTDNIGNFFLVPSNGRTSGEGGDLALLLSAADLSHALRTNQAGEIALITDACFSSAIVESDTFKPGPLGDAGLGQLAYDKGILILAASQADNYAVELPSLNHGLLTFALAGPGEGLELPGRADTSADGRIMLDEWLAYAETRLPSLSADLEIGRFNATRGRSEAVSAAAVEEGYIQRPTFFNFNPSPSRVSLRPG